MRSRTIIHNGTIPTLCRQCAHHCGVNVHVEKGRLTRISGNKSHPENRGVICPKGREAARWVYHPQRLTGCLKRTQDGGFRAITYDHALDEIAGKIMRIKDRTGARAMSTWTGEAIGFLQQEAYAQRFINAFGSPNFFTADSVCFALRLMAYMTCQGYWSYPPDFERAGTTILWGSNPAHSHPPFMWRINRSRRRGGRLIVVDPRLSATAKKADLFLQIRPGTDAALALALIRFLIHKKAYDRDFVLSHSHGFTELAAYADRFTPVYVAQETGIAEQLIRQMQDMILPSLPRCVSFPGISLEHQVNGFDTIRAIACLSALCGAIDIRGGEPWNTHIQVNSLIPFSKEWFNTMEPAGSARYPLFYDVLQKCHSIPGIDYMLGKGKYPIKGLIISGTNPVLTNPNAQKVAKAFAGLDLLVARDLFMTESAKLAHYIIPAASFLERSELHTYPDVRRLGLSRKVLEFEGVWDEYTFWHDLAHRLGFGGNYFPWKNEEAVNRWLLEPTGISYDTLLDTPEGVVYHAATDPKKYRKRPFPTPSGKFEFTAPHLKSLGGSLYPAYTQPDYVTGSTQDFPLRMISGARRAVYNHSRFREIDKFRRAVPRAQVEIHTDDALQLNIKDGETVRIISSTGEINITAKVLSGRGILKGFVEVPHGWDSPNVNRLTNDRDADPIGGFPNLKIVPVRIEKLHTRR